MKRSTGLLFVLGALLLSGRTAPGSLAAQNDRSAPGRVTGTVEISFPYTRQPGAASNQFAVWIEDTEGRVVKTLYATAYTAQGGWERRPESIPRWVSRSGLAGMSRQDVDALSGPTPRPGILRYSWNAPEAGVYRVCVEATLRRENQVLYQVEVEPGGGAAEFQVEPQYFGTGTAERGMIGAVTVRVR